MPASTFSLATRAGFTNFKRAEAAASRLNRFEDAVLRAVDLDAERITAILQELIRTPSPSGAEGTAADASSMVGKVFSEASGHGTSVSSQPVAPSSENVIEVLDGAGQGAFVIEAHTDAVPEGDGGSWLFGDAYAGRAGWVEYLGENRVAVEVDAKRIETQIRPAMARVWERHRSDRRRRILYGRGSFDNKGCVASALLATGALARACRELDVRLGGAVIAAYTVDEEEAASGVRHFACGPSSWLASHGYLSGSRAADGMLTDVSGVALDGSYGWTPVVGHRGALELAIRTRGRAAHAATPHLGVNAVTAMARILTALADGSEELAERAGAGLTRGLLGPLTVVTGSTIVGGGVRTVRRDGQIRVDRSALNVVPDWCEATLDIRFPQGRRYPTDTVAAKDGVLAAVRQYIDLHVEREGWSYDIEEIMWTPPVAMAQSIEAAAALPIVRQQRRRATQVLGYEPDLEIAPGGTDATYMIHDAQIPSIVELGPAGGLSHDVHEYVEIDSVIAGAKILALLALDRVGLAG